MTVFPPAGYKNYTLALLALLFATLLQTLGQLDGVYVAALGAVQAIFAAQDVAAKRKQA